MIDFWGIRKRTENRLNKLGIKSIKELVNADPLLLNQKLGTIGLQHFFHANGIDESNVREKFDFLSIQKESSLSEGSRVIYRNKLIGSHAASQNKEDKDVS